MQLPGFVRLLRGETNQDTRPNKSLEVPTTHQAWESYQYKSRWSEVVHHGVKPQWKRQFAQQGTPPPNHGSAKRALNTIVKNLRAGQDTNRYLVLDLDLLTVLEGVTCSPFGAVQKGEVDISIDARIIHDLSYPPGTSVNDNSIADENISITYDGPDALANRVLDVAEARRGQPKMMTGDVHGAFRHIPLAADDVGRFAGTFPELGILVIDLYCPFGWKNSPSSYWLAGAAVKHLYAHSRPSWSGQAPETLAIFDAKAWCDDHISIEANVGSRLQEAEIALRTAMTTILGPDACNEKKFASWFVQGRALGLDWDLQKLSVSMPQQKIEKALSRVRDMAQRSKATRTQLQKLMGSLRHVVTCIRPAVPFFQRVAALTRQAPRVGVVAVSPGARDDLRWFKLVLAIGSLNAIPLTRFTCRHDPNYHIQMDASDHGLCATFPAKMQYLQVQFNEGQLISEFNSSGDGEFGINVRKLMSAVFASIVWGPVWGQARGDQTTHVRFWIDNTAAVSWNNRRSSRNCFAQMLLRILGLCEVEFGFYSTAVHIAGVENEMADSGSRVCQSPNLSAKFSNMSRDWKQVQIPEGSRDLSLLWERYSAQGL